MRYIFTFALLGALTLLLPDALHASRNAESPVLSRTETSAHFRTLVPVVLRCSEAWPQFVGQTVSPPWAGRPHLFVSDSWRFCAIGGNPHTFRFEWRSPSGVVYTTDAEFYGGSGTITTVGATLRQESEIGAWSVVTYADGAPVRTRNFVYDGSVIR